MKTWFDFETTFQLYEKNGKIKKTPSPYHPKNKLVSVGYQCEDGEQDYLFFFHNQLKDIPQVVNKEKFQRVLDKTSCLVAHHAKFDLQWLWEANFNYDRAVKCTMVGEYVLSRGRKWGLKLEECCKRNAVQLKKSELIDGYMDA